MAILNFKKKYHLTITLFLSIFLGSVSLFPQSRKEIKIIEKQRDKLLFNVKLKNKNIFEKINFTWQKNAIIIPVTIKGIVYNFLFDTGAITLFSDSLAKNLNTNFGHPIQIVDADAIEKTISVYAIDNFRVNSIQFDNVSYGVANLDDIEKQICMRIDGLLGTNILRLLNWEIDFDNQTITISDKSFSSNNYVMEILFEESFSCTPEIKMTMGEYCFSAILDMGNNDLIQLPDSLFFLSRKSRYLKYAKGKGKTTETLFNDDTPQIQYVSEIDSLYIGNNLILNEVVKITPSPIILIGNSFLAKYGNIAINWKKRKIFLGRPSGNTINENNEISEFSPYLKDNKLIIGFLWENTKLQKEGAEIGDQILNINGIPTEEINAIQWCKIREILKEAENFTLELLKPTGEKIISHSQSINYKSLIGK